MLNEKELLYGIILQVFDVLSLFENVEFCFASKRHWGIQPSLDSSGKLARHIQPLQGSVLPILILRVNGPDRALSDPEGPYDHFGVPLERTYLKNQYAGACALKNIVAIKRAAGRPADTYLGKVLALSIEITLDFVQITCHWITSHDGIDQHWSRRTHEPVYLSRLPKVQKLIRNPTDWAVNALRDLADDVAVQEYLDTVGINNTEALAHKRTPRSGNYRRREAAKGLSVRKKEAWCCMRSINH